MPPLLPSEGRCEVGRYYLLPDGAVVEEPDHPKRAQWYESSYDNVRCLAITTAGYGVVQTVFPAVNMTLSKDGSVTRYWTDIANRDSC